MYCLSSDYVTAVTVIFQKFMAMKISLQMSLMRRPEILNQNIFMAERRINLCNWSHLVNFLIPVFDFSFISTSPIRYHPMNRFVTESQHAKIASRWICQESLALISCILTKKWALSVGRERPAHTVARSSAAGTIRRSSAAGAHRRSSAADTHRHSSAAGAPRCRGRPALTVARQRPTLIGWTGPRRAGGEASPWRSARAGRGAGDPRRRRTRRWLRVLPVRTGACRSAHSLAGTPRLACCTDSHFNPYRCLGPQAGDLGSHSPSLRKV